MESLRIDIKLPVRVYVDNVGAIHMARNNISSTATRHVNYRINFTREVHGRMVELFFVRSEENEADILTKNATAHEHEKHSKKLVGEIPNHLLPVDFHVVNGKVN